MFCAKHIGILQERKENVTIGYTTDMYPRRHGGLMRFTRSKIAPVVLIILTAIIANAAMNMYGRFREANIRADRAQEEIVSLEERKNELRADLERLGTPRGTEEELRKRFNVAGEGEGVIVIVDPRTQTANNDSMREESIWQKILNMF